MQQSDTVAAWMSGYAFQSFVLEILTALGQHTLFVGQTQVGDTTLTSLQYLGSSHLYLTAGQIARVKPE